MGTPLNAVDEYNIAGVRSRPIGICIAAVSVAVTFTIAVLGLIGFTPTSPAPGKISHRLACVSNLFTYILSLMQDSRTWILSQLVVRSRSRKALLWGIATTLYFALAWRM